MVIGYKYVKIKSRQKPKNMEYQNKKQPARQEQEETAPEDYSNILLIWEAREYEKPERHKNWPVIVFAIAFCLVVYALFTDNLLMAILFILLAVTLYLFEKKESDFHAFKITTEGILAQEDFYDFSTLESFWIFYEPSGKKILSLKSKKGFTPHIHIPLGSTDPIEIRELLLEFLPEEKQEEGLVELLERFL